MINKNAIYPLSADPIHNGHLYNIETAVKMGLFDKIYVAIGNNTTKNALFNPEERIYLAKKAIAPLGLENDIIESFEGMLGHYAFERNAQVLIRGSRAGIDFDYEQRMAEFNRKYGLTSLVIPSAKEVAYLSSTFLKEIVKSGGLVNNSTHPAAKQALEERLQKVSLIGVTGNMGAGKSYNCKELERRGAYAGLKIKHIDIDKKLHKLYRADAPANPAVYEAMKKAFGEKVCRADRINREALSQIMWGNPEARARLSHILAVPFTVEFEKAIWEEEGIVLMDAAYFVEYSILDWVNYNAIMVGCDEQERKRRVMSRDGIDLKEFNQKISAQMPANKISQEILKQQKAVGHGFYYEIDSQKPDYETILALLKKEFPLFKTTEKNKKR